MEKNDVISLDISDEKRSQQVPVKRERALSIQQGGDVQLVQKPKKKKSWYTIFEMLFLFSVFMLSGPLLIMSNKYILRDLDFRFPLTLTLLTLLFSSLSCWLYVWFTGTKLKHADQMTLSFFLKRICPIGALSAGTIVLGMASYLFLTVAFIQMLKAFTPVMTMFGLVLFRLENPKVSSVVCVLIICMGTAIAGFGEMNFSLVGIFCMLLAQVFEALKLIFTQLVLQDSKFGLVESLYYITPTSAAFVLAFAVVLEFPLMKQADWDIMLDNLYAFLLSCSFAIMTNVINTFVIQFSSALALKLLATARNALLVMFNAMILGEIVTAQQFFGYFVSLAGFCAYNYFKSRP